MFALSTHLADRSFVQKKILAIMAHVIGCVRSKLASKVGFFEFYGLDFMIDNDMKACFTVLLLVHLYEIKLQYFTCLLDQAVCWRWSEQHV